MEVSEGGREKDAAKAKATAKGPPPLHYCICSVPGPPLASSTLCNVQCSKEAGSGAKDQGQEQAGAEAATEFRSS